jgi:hypothetical protein
MNDKPDPRYDFDLSTRLRLESVDIVAGRCYDSIDDMLHQADKVRAYLENGSLPETSQRKNTMTFSVVKPKDRS